MQQAPLFEDIARGPIGGRAFWRNSEDGLRLRLAHWPRAKDAPHMGTIFLFPGRTEYIEKYGLTAAELATRGHDVLTIDWRGQGLSDRPSQAPMLGHVEDFAEYQLDVAVMADLARDLNLPRPFTLLAHSMGGCIGLRALHNGFDVAGACFSAPMWGVIMAPWLRPVAWAGSWGLRGTAWRYLRVPGTTDKTYVAEQPFEDNTLTTEPQMYALMQDQAKARPELTLGGPTAAWLYAALSEMHALSALPPPDVATVTFLGTDESIVDSAPIRRLMARWHMGRLEIANGCRHEVLMEAPAVRNRVYDALSGLSIGSATTPDPAPRV